MKRPEGFQDAEALAEVANLNTEDLKAVAYFRNNYPDFAPAEWWDYKYEELSLIRTSAIDDPNHTGAIGFEGVFLWQVAQEEIQQVWADQFKFASVFNLTALLKIVFVSPTAEMVWDQSYLDMPDGMYHEYLADKAYSFHQAVLFLHRQPWRAKICDEKRKGCGKYFVANHPARDFCEYPDAEGETCRQKDDKRRKLEYYYATGKKKRQAKMRKGSPRLQGSQPKRALR